jgi:hypothetical protein
MGIPRRRLNSARSRVTSIFDHTPKTSGPTAPSRTWSRRQAAAGSPAASSATEHTAARLGRLGGWPRPEYGGTHDAGSTVQTVVVVGTSIT